MYDIALRYLARLWLEPGASKQLGFYLKPLAEALNEGELDVMHVNHLEPGTNVLTQRQQLFTADGAWQITVLGPGIDLTHSAQEPVSLVAFAERARSLFGATFRSLDGANASRIAMITEGMLADVTTAEKNAVAGRLLTFPDVFAPAPWEWDWRCVASVDREFGGSAQATNTIASMKRAAGIFNLTQQPFDRLRVDLDINTPATDLQPRFNATAIDDFVRQFPAWHATLGDSVLRTAGLEQ
ncbi:MAG: hypothetical protein ABI488_23535 [Polyangiaceae bacterium]